MVRTCNHKKGCGKEHKSVTVIGLDKECLKKAGDVL